LLSGFNGQIVDGETARREEFYSELKNIEFHAARISENPNSESTTISAKSLMQTKSLALLIEIINFLSSAFLFFSRGKIGSFNVVADV
jgi:hypothetical protein